MDRVRELTFYGSLKNEIDYMQFSLIRLDHAE